MANGQFADVSLPPLQRHIAPGPVPRLIRRRIVPGEKPSPSVGRASLGPGPAITVAGWVTARGGRGRRYVFASGFRQRGFRQQGGEGSGLEM